jgi:pyruvate/2-oxoglutarate/acetoin dehydrogenase E1 component
MAKMSYLEAGRLALEEEMRLDPTVWALGEDLGRGGVFGQYKGLAELFGMNAFPTHRFRKPRYWESVWAPP